MPVDFTANPNGENTGDLGSDPNAAEAPMFAPIPTWERNRKRRGSSGGRSGASRAAEPRSFAEPSDAALTGATAGAATGATTSDTAFAGAPTYADRRTTVRKRGGSAAPMAIAAGLIVLAGVAAAGWYASQPHDQGVAQLTPGGPGAAAVVNGAPPATGPALAQAPSNAPMPAPAPARTATRNHAIASAAPVRHRPVSRSAEEVGVEASATVATPRPAPRPAPQAAPVNPAPVNPAPTQAAPAAPPPVDQPAPTQTAPTAPPSPPQTTSPTPPPDQPPPQ